MEIRRTSDIYVRDIEIGGCFMYGMSDELYMRIVLDNVASEGYPLAAVSLIRNRVELFGKDCMCHPVKARVEYE